MELAEVAKLVTEYDYVRSLRLAQDKVAKDLKKKEDDLGERLIIEMRAQDVNFVANDTRRVKRTPKTKHKADDWVLFYAYMAKNNAMDLVQKRLSEAAITEREEDGITIPGLVKIKVDSLSIGNI